MLTKNDFIDRLWQDELARQAAFVEARRQKFLPTAKNLRLAGDTLADWRASASELLATESERAEACREAGRARLAIEARIAADERRNQAALEAADSVIANAQAELNRIKSCRPFLADTAEVIS